MRTSVEQRLINYFPIYVSLVSVLLSVYIGVWRCICVGMCSMRGWYCFATKVKKKKKNQRAIVVRRHYNHRRRRQGGGAKFANVTVWGKSGRIWV